jgi:phage gp36-like protein
MAITLNAYCGLADLKSVRINPGFFTGDLSPTDDACAQALNDAKGMIDSKIAVSSAITLPLSEPYDPNLVKANAVLAIWDLMSVRGFNPDSSTDKAVRMRYDDAMKWLTAISENRAKLQQVTSNRIEGVQPDIINSCDRGLRNWNGIVGSGGGW